MSEQERILALLQAGKITPQEAELLLSALEENDKNPGSPPVEEPPGLHWARVRLTAGRLEARLDPSLSQPQVEGQAEVQPVGDDVQVIPHANGVLGGWLGKGVSLVLRLPPGWGLEVDSKAAELEVEGLRFFKGRVAAGYVALKAVEGLDLEVSAGNIEGSLLLREGQHRLWVSMGNAELAFLPGSSVTLRPSVSLGNLECPNRQIGQGQASLEASVRLGNLELINRA
ncbi:SHOCT-like domain-containing protein [Meiothermus rufus]|uniref:SHOCT-like domain-containing protein n=1 Tax=Meiothermus rufus TaxID=604332 RepID=UPI0004243D2C|nr:hypothetical protein [Meiothermus rufus]